MEMVICQEVLSHGKNIYGNLTAARHAPSKKVRYTRYYRFLRCAFLSVKQNNGKNTAPARSSCLLAHVEPFFHFQNSVGDHTRHMHTPHMHTRHMHTPHMHTRHMHTHMHTHMHACIHSDRQTDIHTYSGPEIHRNMVHVQ